MILSLLNGNTNGNQLPLMEAVGSYTATDCCRTISKKRGVISIFPRLWAHARNTPGKINDDRRMAQDCLEVIQRFYSLLKVPDSLMLKKKRATSNAYPGGISYAFEQGRRWDLIIRFAIMAVIVDPANTGPCFVA